MIKSLNISFFLFLGLFFSTCLSILAQKQEHCQWIKPSSTIQLNDSLLILPRSIVFFNPQNQPISFQFNYSLQQKTLQIQDAEILKYDSLRICYRYFPFAIDAKKFRRNPKLLDSIRSYQDYQAIVVVPNQEKREEFLQMQGLNTTGNISRGISFGNTQNVFVNSALNLQLDGKISKDIGIKATITDQNVPFQPEGNTQTIQQFDRILVQLTQKNNTLSAGDIVLKNRENHFLKYYKNVQGAFVEVNHQQKEGKNALSTFGVAVAKGKFASIQVTALEGVLGPYRLTGPNGERFIVVIANSEKVFIDGQLLRRGFNLDYVIDYNNAEITFTNQVIITQFTRIRVDFEYADRNFNRTIWQFTHENAYKNFNFFGNIYQEADNPNAPVNINLTQQDRLQLANAGNNTNLTFVNGIDSTGFIQGQNMYKKIDTLVNGIIYRGVLIPSNNTKIAYFRVTFSQVGQNRGNYIRRNTTSNGQVFDWIAPQNGIPQGDFEPVRLITAPNRKRMLTFGGNYVLTKTEKIYAEIANSNQDLNLFSTIGNNENAGYALKVGYKNEGKDIRFLKDYQYNLLLDYEFTDKYFKRIDRFRYIEFDRDWSINPDTTQLQDHIFTLQTRIKNKKSNFLDYKIIQRSRENQVNGIQQIVQLEQNLNSKVGLKTYFFQMNNTQNILKSSWIRLNTDLAWREKKWQLGYQFNLDKNKISQKNNDSILTTALFFEENKWYLKYKDTLKTFSFLTEYTLRTDFLPVEGQIKPFLNSQTFNLIFQKKIHNNQDLNLIITHRTMQNRLNLNLDNPNFIPENIQGRIDYNASFFDKHIRSELTANTATGQELKREFQYIAVTSGIGTHTWRDDNKDGVQDLNEFYLAINPDERNFIKIFTPTNEYLRAFTYNFSYRLNVEMPRNWKKSLVNYKHFLSKISVNTTYTLNRRSTKADVSTRFLPLGQNILDNSVLGTQSNWRSTLFFNRTNAKYGIELQYLQTQQKQLLNNGFELRIQTEYKATYRQNLHKNWNLRITSSQNLQKNRSDFLITRNFNILNQQISPEISYQPNNDIRISTIFNWINKTNLFRPENPPANFIPEIAKIQQINLELRWNKVSKRSFLSNVRYWNIRYIGDPNTPVGYEMLEALRVGANWTWNITLQQRLANGLQLNLTYEGRKTPNNPLVNIGRMQVAALF